MTSAASEAVTRGPATEADVRRLIAALDRAGLDVPVSMALQLHRMLPGMGPATPSRLAGTVVALVAKRSTHVSGARDAALTWAGTLPRAGVAVSVARPMEARASSEAPSAAEAPARALRWRWIIAGAAALGLIALAAGQMAPAPPAADPLDRGPSAADATVDVIADATTDATALPRPLESFTLPDVRVVDRPPASPTPWSDWLLLGLGLGTLGGLLLLRSRWAGFGEPLSVGAGPPPGPPPRTPRAARHMLDRRAESLVVWGIDHYVGTDETRRLDIAATVRATAARGGRPTLVRRRSRHPREIWLWVDDAATDPELPRVVEALTAALRASNLPVEVAHFHGELAPLVDEEDAAVLDPVDLDERRSTARVAILTDGALLTDRLRDSGAARARLDSELRLLSRWPALAFFEFGPGTHRLAEQLAPYDIPVLPAERLYPWLGRVPLASTGEPDNDRTLWRAALALSPSAVDLDTALALRAELGLSAPASALRAITADAGGAPIAWPAPTRERWLTWLATALHPDRLADVRGFWLAYFVAAAESPRRPTPGEAMPSDAITLSARPGWEPTRWQAETASAPRPPQWHAMAANAWLVALWHPLERAADPTPITRVVDALYGLHEGTPAIADHLGRWQASDGISDADDRRARLPWRFDALPVAARVKLREMGLGGLDSAQRSELAQRPGSAWVALGAAAAVVLAGLLALIGRLDDPPPPPEPAGWITVGEPPAEWDTVADGDRFGRRRLAWTLGAPGIDDSGGAREVMLGVSMGQPIHAVRAEAGQDLRLDWRSPTRYACTRQMGDLTVWFCGTEEPATPPLGDWPARSIVLLDASPEDTSAHRLALHLLDRAAADQVWFIAGAAPADTRTRVAASTAQAGRGDAQLIHITRGSDAPAYRGATRIVADDWTTLRRAVGGGEARPAAEVWPTAEVTGDAVLPSAGCRAGHRRLVRGIPLRCVPSGVYWMGSEDGGSDERPRHRVQLSEYWIAETETTQAQYRALAGATPSRFEGDDRPVEQVSWDDAQALCAKLGGRLPTEAEWEVACRAGTETRWSTGDDEAGLAEAAWYDANAENRTHPVAQKAANAWGLYDMHGNVWEWTADVYDASTYRQRVDKVVRDPLRGADDAVRGDRVLRGGSFVLRAVNLRSAVRNRNSPSNRFRNIGFRCVWGARQQRPSQVAP